MTNIFGMKGVLIKEQASDVFKILFKPTKLF